MRTECTEINCIEPATEYREIWLTTYLLPGRNRFLIAMCGTHGVEEATYPDKGRQG